MGPSHNLWFYACKTAWLAPELQVSMGLSPRLCFLHVKQCICTKMTSSHGFQPSSVVLCMQNGDFRTRITRLCRWRDPTCGFCMQNCDFWTRMTSLYGFQPSSLVWCMQTATLGPDLHVCMGPRPHPWFWAHITSCLAQESINYIGSSPHLCVFFMQNSDFMIRLTSLYGSQTSSVVLSTHNSVLSTRINRLYWFQPSPVVLCKPLELELQVSVGPRPHLWFLHAKERLLDPNNKYLRVPDIICRFVHVQQRA